MKKSIVSSLALAGLFISGQALAHIHYHEAAIDGPALTEAMTAHGWGYATDFFGGPAVDDGNTGRYLGDSHLMTFYSFNNPTAQEVTITLTSQAADLDPAFTLSKGLLPLEAHDNTAIDPLNMPGAAGSRAPHPKDSAYYDSNQYLREGQFNPFGKWSMANDAGEWAETDYVAHANNNTGMGAGQFETLTLFLQPGDYMIAAAGATLDDLLPVANLATLSITAATTAVPVPAAVWLFSSALAGMGVIGRRRKEATA